jgi:hypothetical protein
MTETTNAVALQNPAQLPVEEMTDEKLLAGLSKLRGKLGGDFKLFLNFDGRVGTFKYKDDDIDVPVKHGTLVAVNMLQAIQGYTCWKGGQPVDSTVPISVFHDDPYQGQDLDAVLPDHGPYKKEPNQKPEGWVGFIQYSFKMMDSGKEFLFKVSSKSGIRAARAFNDKVMEAMQAGTSIKEDIPIVELSAAKFTVGSNVAWKPSLKIVRWERGAMKANTPEASKAAFAQAQQNASEPVEADTAPKTGDPMAALKKLRK